MYARPAISWTVDSVSSQNSPHKPVVHRQILYTLSKFLLTTSNVCWRRLLRVPWTARRSNQSILKEINHWKDWCWSWSSNTLATWCEKLTHLKRHWCWERLKAGGEGDDRGWDGWMASPTQWTSEFKQTLRDSEGPRSLACCSPWGHKLSDTT